MLQFLQGIIRFFLPVETYFFDFVDAAAVSTHEAALRLEELCNSPSGAEREGLVAQIREAEHAGDKALRDMADALDRTFVTPLDREDLYELTSSIESVSDFVEATGGQVILHHMKEIPEGAVELSRLLVQATTQIRDATPLLRTGNDGGMLRAACQAIADIEHEGDVVFRREVARRFAEETDAIRLLKHREFLEGLEDSIDKCQRVARVLESILIKNG